MIKGAIISECGKYRYQLWRIWDDTKSKCLFIMHNPSIADANDDDPTIRRCIAFAKSWGYGGIYVGNNYPYRATDPKELQNKPFLEIAPLENIQHINEMVSKCDMHILAYGNLVIRDSGPFFIDNKWHYLKLTKSGNPCHPLYLKSDLKPIPFHNKEDNYDNEEDDFDEDNFQCCNDCDLPDACADFGCAIKNGVRKPFDTII